jgi:hypothetical protein
MKSIIKYLLIIACAMPFAACEEDLLNEEHYKPMIYMKSGDNNIFSYPHEMNDAVSTGYMTIGSGGSMPLKNDVAVKIEMDEESLNLYNYRFFGDETDKYARLLPQERFVIPSYDIILKAGDAAATTFFPIEIDVNGLSPDTTYMVPVRIQSASGYEMNEEKRFVLYRIELGNAYSSHTSRMYKMRGTKHQEGGIKSNITTNKTLVPLSRNQVRLFPENLTSSTSLQTIRDRAIVLVINDDQTVRLKPFKNIEIEPLDECTYDPEEKVFTINYRYRLPGETKWTTVMELLTRIE